jgi:hypothetical protein
VCGAAQVQGFDPCVRDGCPTWFSFPGELLSVAVLSQRIGVSSASFAIWIQSPVRFFLAFAWSASDRTCSLLALCRCLLNILIRDFSLRDLPLRFMRSPWHFSPLAGVFHSYARVPVAGLVLSLNFTGCALLAPFALGPCPGFNNIPARAVERPTHFRCCLFWLLHKLSISLCATGAMLML